MITFWKKIMTLAERFRLHRTSETLPRRPSQEVFAQLAPLHGKKLLAANPVKEVIAYASDWRPFLANTSPKVKPDDLLHIDPHTNIFELPHPFISPSTKETTDMAFWGNAQFYWDTYFINKALTLSKNPQLIDLAKGQVQNLIYMFNLLDYIPNASKLSIANRTQIPFLTGMILDVYKATGDKEWLKSTIAVAKREYDNWMLTEKELKAKGLSRPSHRISETSLLIRPTGRDILNEHYPAAVNTGMDDSAEWARRPQECVPVSLNCAIAKYENDFARVADILGDSVEKGKWESISQKRREQINALLWDEKEGRYCNAFYDATTKSWKRDTVYHSLTSFMPLWINLASNDQVDKLIKHLPEFTSPYGLMIGAKNNTISKKTLERFAKSKSFKDPKLRRFLPAFTNSIKPEQWEYPRIWAPFVYFTVDGLLNYGKREEAKAALESSVRGLAAFYAEKKTLPEKINGTTGLNGDHYNYPDQEGFGWTNALVLIAHQRLSEMEEIADQAERAYATIAS